MFETLSTRICKYPHRIKQFKDETEKPYFSFIDDAKYKNKAFEDLILHSSKNRSISLADSVLRLMILDKKLKIDYLLTYNIKDFHDVCKRMNVEIYYP